MNKLKTWLKYSLFLIGVVYIVLSLFFLETKTSYHKKTNAIQGRVHNLKWRDNRLELTIKGKEKIIAYYSFENELEKTQFQKRYQLGDIVFITGDIYRPPKERVFFLFNYRQYLKSQKIYWLFNAQEITLISKNQIWYWRIKNFVINRIDNLVYSGDYVANFILNEREIADEIMNSYQQNGVIHLLAISGTHIAFLILLLKKLKINDLIIISFLFFYLLLTGFAISLTRAVLFYFLLLINKFFSLAIKAEKILLFLVFMLLLYNPFFIYDIGFQFSFIISFFLIRFQELIKKQRNYVTKSFMVSLIAFLTSLPIIFNNFFEFNLFTPFLNLIFVPIFSAIIYPFALLTFLIPSFDYIFFQIITIAEKLSVFFSQYAFMITMPKINIFLALLYYLTLYFLFSFFRLRNFIILILLMLCHKNMAFLNPYGVITFIDVGQGDAILIETPRQKTTILVDTGGVYFPDFRQFIVQSRIIPYLKARGITKLDLLVLTHGHYDHLGEAITLLENFPVKKVVLNKGDNNLQEKRIISYLEKNSIAYQQISKKDFLINQESFHFLNNKEENCENEDSLILYTIINNHRLLLMGDAGFKSEEYLLDNYQLNEISVLKVGHHGSRYSSSEAFIKKTNPQKAIIMAGENNRFNHPHLEVLELFDQHDVNYYITGEEGSIKIILKENLKILTTKKGN